MLRWRSVTIATTPGTRGVDVTTPSRTASAAALKFVLMIFLHLYWNGFVDAALRSVHGKTLVVVGRDLVTLLTIGADATAVGQHTARFALDVRAQIPRMGFCDQRRIGDLIVMGHPSVLRLLCRFDDLEALATHVGDAVGDPFDLLLQARSHVAERSRRSERHRGREKIRIAVNLQAHRGADIPAPVILQ